MRAPATKLKRCKVKSLAAFLILGNLFQNTFRNALGIFPKVISSNSRYLLTLKRD